MGEALNSKNQSTANPENAVSMRSNRDNSIANTIYQQLGGRRFTVMTGARNMVAIKNGLRFDIGRNGSQANRVEITLRGDDTYDMRFIKKGRDFNEAQYLATQGAKLLRTTNSQDEFNAKYKAMAERAKKNAQPKVLKEYNGVYFDQLQSLFTEYTKLYTRF